MEYAHRVCTSVQTTHIGFHCISCCKAVIIYCELLLCFVHKSLGCICIDSFESDMSLASANDSNCANVTYIPVSGFFH